MEIVFFIKVVIQYAYICFKFDKLDTILDLPNFGVFAWRCLLADYLGGYHQSGEPVGQRMMMNIKVGLDSWKADDRLQYLEHDPTNFLHCNQRHCLLLNLLRCESNK